MSLFSTLLSIFSGCDKQTDNSSGCEVRVVNVNEILFSMATICDELPPSDSNAEIPSDALQMHEDYWRQVEFVSSASVSQVGKALKEFLVFREAHRKGIGFTETYIRKNVYPSLDTLGVRRGAIAPELRSLVIYGALVVGGFAVTDASGAYLYGQALLDGTVKHLGIEPPSGKRMSDNFIRLIADLAEKHGLILVDWYKGVLVEEVTGDTLTQWAAMYNQVAPCRAGAQRQSGRGQC